MPGTQLAGCPLLQFQRPEVAQVLETDTVKVVVGPPVSAAQLRYERQERTIINRMEPFKWQTEIAPEVMLQDPLLDREWMYSLPNGVVGRSERTQPESVRIFKQHA